MKKILVISIILNICFLAFVGYSIHKKGGVTYLKSKFSGSTTKEGNGMPSWYYKNSLHWKETKSLYDALPNDPNEIIFLGNSLIYRCDWADLFSNPRIKNRGIGGDSTEGILERLDEVLESGPDKIFICIGSNDIGMKIGLSEAMNNYKKILDEISGKSPDTKVYIQSVLPTYGHPERDNTSIASFNDAIKDLALEKKVTYLHLFDAFCDNTGNLKKEVSYDGVHLNGQGYLLWKGLIENEVNDLSD